MKYRFIFIFFLCFGPPTLQPLPAFAQAIPAASTPAKSPQSETDLKVVPHAEVCMVNNTHFGRPQIPVEVAGKTYYGCCEMCKSTLNNDSSARTGIEALTGKRIDKASAVIAANSKGDVLYFASEANLKKYLARHTK